MKEIDLDAIDLQLLEQLQKDASLSNQVLACQRHGQAGSLDGRHGIKAQLLQIGQRGRCEGESRESSHLPIIGGTPSQPYSGGRALG